MSHTPTVTFQAINIPIYHKTLETLLLNQRKRINQLLKDNTSWTWETLMHPLESMDDELERFWSPLSHLHAVVNTPELRACYQACLPLLSAHESSIGQNQALFNAIQSIDTQALDAAQQHIMKNTLRDFKLSGVALSAVKKKRFEAISTRLSELSNQFESNLLDIELDYQLHITDETELQGLPQYVTENARSLAEQQQKSGWLFTLAFPTYLAIMTYADSQVLRESFYYAYTTRASELGPCSHQFDNMPVISEMLLLRHEEAKLLDFKNYAELSLATKMATSTQEVEDFLLNLIQRARPQAEREYHELLSFAQSNCHLDSLDPWDIAYVSQKMKQHLYTLNDEELRAYFPLPRVMNGLFSILQQLYQVTLVEVTTPVDKWHPDVKCYALYHANKQVLGYLYLDLFARPNKRSGAWMDNFQSRFKQTDALQLPIASLTCNFANTQSNQPATLSHDEVITLFHEFGHCLHHLLTQVEYMSASGIHGVEWDAVELPSQFFENWCWSYEALQHISSHVKTEEPIPKPLFDNLLASQQFQSALAIVRQLSFSLFDFRLHLTNPLTTENIVETTQKNVRALTQVLPMATYTRQPNQFSHIFAGGYAAGYYSYLWAEVLSCDAFARFVEEGLFSQKAGQDFLHCILETGGSRPAAQSYRCFRGRDATLDAFLKQHGICLP